ncbi:hypothetical protein JXD38_10575 [candidate division WOR-3 bacterium]|nr:hypothetical protein [candidate division WOR-3 bacterium]
MRTFKRLLPILVVILLTSVVLARPAAFVRVGPNSVAEVTKPVFSRDSYNPPCPRLDFGTVVRDTADDQSIGPVWSERPNLRIQQVVPNLPWWVWCFSRNLGGLLMISR